MPLVIKSALVPYSAERIYALINDVEAYPAFLPWCRSTELLSHTEEEMCARIEVARSGIHQSFATCNRLTPPERIEINLTEGPFRRLHGAWNITPLREDACKIELELEFEFSGRLINAAFGAVFGQIANTLVDSFCRRAAQVYGTRDDRV